MKLRRGPEQIDDGSVSTGHHRGQGGKADWWLQPVDHRLEPVDHTQYGCGLGITIYTISGVLLDRWCSGHIVRLWIELK